MKMLLEITVLITAALALIPCAKSPKVDGERFAHLDSVGTFGM